jgi:hypothetical protein
MPILIGNRDDVVRTTTGHTVSFKAGEETFVPDNNVVVKSCIERGHLFKKESPAAPVVPTPQAKDPKVAKAE